MYNMEIIRAILVCSRTTDKIIFEINKPSGDDLRPNGNATVVMTVAWGSGEEYLKKNFPEVPYEKIN